MVIRTKLQQDIYDALTKARIPFYYRETAQRGEEVALLVDLPDRSRANRFYPTFIVTCDDGTRVVLQQKGRFVTADRQKLRLLKQQHPTVEFRMIFSNSAQRISSTSATKYSDWCERFGIAYCDGKPSQEWIEELQRRTVGQVQGWVTPPVTETVVQA